MPELMLLLMPERREPTLLLFLKSTPMTARGRGRAAAGVQSSLCATHLVAALYYAGNKVGLRKVCRTT